MAEHRHRFEHQGGGTFLPTQESDDVYLCQCGEQITVYSSPNVHACLPRTIECNELPREVPVNVPPPLDTHRN